MYKYQVGRYYDQDTFRHRYAVLGPSGEWYFAKRYGKAAADVLCKYLNNLEVNKHANK